MRHPVVTTICRIDIFYRSVYNGLESYLGNATRCNCGFSPPSERFTKPFPNRVTPIRSKAADTAPNAFSGVLLSWLRWHRYTLRTSGRYMPAKNSRPLVPRISAKTQHCLIIICFQHYVFRFTHVIINTLTHTP